MSLYTIPHEKKPSNKEDLKIATCFMDGKEKDVYWTLSKDTPKLTTIKCKNAEPAIIKTKNQIFSAFISGASGSGKSTYAVKLINELLRIDKSIENVFYITAQLMDDPVLQELKSRTKTVSKKIKKNGMVEVKEPIFVTLDIHNPSLYEMDISFFENSIIYYDDYEVLPKKTEEQLNLFVRASLNMGRKSNINVILIRHKIQNYSKTAEIIMECQNIITFPKFNLRDTTKFLDSYLSFTKEEIQEVRNFDTRALFIRKTVPNYMISEDQITLL